MVIIAFGLLRGCPFANTGKLTHCVRVIINEINRLLQESDGMSMTLSCLL